MRGRVRVAGIVVLVADEDSDQFGDAARRRDPRSAGGARGEVRQQLRRDALRVDGGSMGKHRHAGLGDARVEHRREAAQVSAGLGLVERRAVREVRDRTQRVAGVEEKVLFGPVVVHSAADGEIPRREDEGPRERRDDARGDERRERYFRREQVVDALRRERERLAVGPSSSSPWPLPSASPSARGRPRRRAPRRARGRADPSGAARGQSRSIWASPAPEDLRLGLRIVAEPRTAPSGRLT